jgi:hypothetical protein
MSVVSYAREEKWKSERQNYYGIYIVFALFRTAD